MTETWVQSLFDEEPEPYGRKLRHDDGVRRRPVSLIANPRRGDYGDPVGELMGPSNPLGAPPLDWWNVSEEEIHRRLILSMCPEKVCWTCGEPSRRITENGGGNMGRDDHRELGGNQRSLYRNPADRVSHSTTIGWTDCGHDDWRPGVVLDPFA